MYKNNNQDNRKKNPHIEKTPWQLAQEKNHKNQQETATEQIKSQKTNKNNIFFKYNSLKKDKLTNNQKEKPIEQTNNDLAKLKRRFILLFIILFLWATYFISPLAKVKEYQFVGTWQVDPVEILSKGGLDNRQSIWSVLAKEEKINQSVTERMPKVKALEVSLKLPNTIVVTVLENPAIAHYLEDDLHFELLADGTKVEIPVDNMDLQYPLLEGFTDKDLAKIASQFSTLSAALIADMKKIELVNEPGIKDRLLIQMKDGTPVIGNLNTIGSKIIYYPRIKQEIGQQKGTIDMEVGVFFTPEVTKIN
ncbi:Cell division septal protein FtsQ [Granulicatella balaenopterae]|uniref:Cell division septal protein FtsQ n=1 Tax=Granulicatella balaenopterae TaxID=137733 RepID=A0A1H9ICD3_9LACT|nr:FtsQ-type POTRA domain-containing protein [Granulicatella balaenopterae]SEQ72247.1 Cell division septal protein FtsQ [Granulicatella balaenopterae]